MAERRVVVTGMGAITPLGANVQETWQNVVAGKSGIGPITLMDASDYACRIGGEVKNFDPSDIISTKDQRKMDRFIQLGVVAAAEALAQAGIHTAEDIQDKNRPRYGVVLGSGIGGINFIEKAHTTIKERGPRRVSPYFVPAMLINLLSGQVSIRYGMQGPNMSHVSACATSAHAIGESAEMIKRGVADVMVAGGAEHAISPIGLGGFAALRALSTGYNDTPEKGSRPFDKNRDGFVMGEGAGVLVLEEYAHAQKRGAKILAEVAGYGLSGDGYHLTLPNPDGSGAKAAMHMALDQAKLAPKDIGYVNAHATSTPLGDEIESRAIENVFGPDILVSATKSMTGHLLGAAGSLEAIFCIKALEEGILPPTINLETPSETCRLDYIPHKARNVQVHAALSNSFGFGGTNAALIFTKER